MLKIPPQKNFLIFWLLVLTDLSSIGFGFGGLHYLVKPLLMPVLMVSLMYPDMKMPGKKIILGGLFFSWLGDIFLLFESGQSIYFIAGLVCFLITHICYIIYFLSIRSDAPSFLKKHPAYLLLIPGYGAALVYLLFPYLGILKIPVIVYGATICAMLLGSLHVYLKVKAPANRYFVSGAALFVLSDSLLAFNKFYQPLPFAGIWIMLSYCAAQFLIVLGLTGMVDSVKYKG